MIVIIGGGISGLTLGYYLQKQKIPYILVEQSQKIGGNIQTLCLQGRTLELGPNTVLAKPHVWELIQELNLTEQIIYPDKKARKRFILKKNGYAALPSNPVSLLLNSFFSLSTKIQILKDLSKKPNPNPPKKETVHDFFVRHFGIEVAEQVVNPFVAGIYAGDSQKLITEYAFPTLIEAEKHTGSIIKGFIKYQKMYRSKGSISFRNGMHTLVQTIYQAQKSSVYLNTFIEKIEFGDLKHTLILSNKNTVSAKRIVFTAPAYSVAKYVESLSADFAQKLACIPYAPVCVVHSVYRKDKVKHKLDGFGALHPSMYNTFILGTIFSSTIFPNTCHSDEVLLTSFIGQKFLSYSQNEIQDKVHQELANYLNITEAPIFTHLHVWEKAIPQYEANYADILPFVHQWESKGIYFSGNWLNGISVEKCIEVNKHLAQKLATLD
ncbi:MAG: protoporphyrinogen oxidase [Bacteroidia bacterium]|nr:protoporphyrinogen oxidase [Bacteroidia bacterium]